MNKFSFPLVKLVSLLLQGFIEVLFNYYTVIQYKYRYFCKEHGRFIFLKCQKRKLHKKEEAGLIDCCINNGRSFSFSLYLKE